MNYTKRDNIQNSLIPNYYTIFHQYPDFDCYL